MSGYRRVNYYELCRLCTASEGTKMHIFREEGRRRQLPSKIQLCLPLQVSEDDSLPKIICSQCVDKLESLFDFRNSCVNAEAMLESYFTTLRYSEDFIREGKVYVKDKSPTRKKSPSESEKTAIKVPNIQAVASIPVNVDGLNNLVQTASIQIVSQTDQEVSRLPQYKCMELQPATAAVSVSGETPVVRYTQYETCGSLATTSTTAGSVGLLKTEDGTQTDYHNHKGLHKPESNQNHQTMDQGTTTYYVRVPNSVEQETSPGQSEGGEAVEEETLHQTITFAPNHGQDMLVHFGFNKEPGKDHSNGTTILRTDERTSIAQIGEFLRMKTVVVEEEPQPSGEPDLVLCDQCGKELTSESQADHALTCSGAADDKGGGHFSCDVCGKPFKRKEHLFQHRKLHTGERPYVCATCGKAFSRKEHLVRHSVSHTGQKVHSCDMCSKSFSRKDNLHKHRKTHGVAGPHVCEICGKSFVVKHYYLMHKTSHGNTDTDQLPYRCDICYKGFSVKQYLTLHKLRHRGKNPVAVDGEVEVEEPSEEVSEENQQEALSTVNTAAILPPNVVHHGNNQSGPLYHVSTTGGTTYLATSANSQMVDNYRRLHST